jgi:hypothetical protein
MTNFAFILVIISNIAMPIAKYIASIKWWARECASAYLGTCLTHVHGCIEWLGDILCQVTATFLPAIRGSYDVEIWVV